MEMEREIEARINTMLDLLLKMMDEKIKRMDEEAEQWNRIEEARRRLSNLSSLKSTANFGISKMEVNQVEEKNEESPTIVAQLQLEVKKLEKGVESTLRRNYLSL
ncbi:hypothetical protein GUJ93_ZPchr0011g27741 [Zizania palustris]|uniref:Uncharacterized protein n=1 Tax=Zizania palustris TaxID=103762 RepID=A0A8J5WGQ2_ZIZPA|nr:hypothetical protein GUJ93_ZPchr0011g27741 [Zizania palustris]